MSLSVDLILSNWIFLWFILFCFGLISYNPLFIFIICYLLCNFSLIYLYYKKKDLYDIKKLVIINLIFKIIPIIILFLMKQYHIRFKDILFSILFVLIYLYYLYINQTNFIIIYSKVLESYEKNNKNVSKGPISKLYDYIYKELFLN
jgi:hypothetical protein